jgi:SAM-dependent methyltransferase
MTTMFRIACLACQSRNLAEIINLGMHPMADTFISLERASEADRVYPLICDLCEDCGNVQLRTETDPAERYVDVDYSYTSSNSNTSRRHWKNYAREVTLRAETPSGASVLEVGSNDGFLSAELAGLGYDVLGIDPSPAMARLAGERGVRTLTRLFDSSAVDAVLAALRERPKLIVANNVFNHANDPSSFVRGIRATLDPEGVFVFELPYWSRSIQDRKFDQVYHEHVSYLTVQYATNLFSMNGMHISDVQEVDYHGGSIRVYVKHGEQRVLQQSAASLIASEQRAGLFKPETYQKFMAETVQTRDRFLERLYALRQAQESLVCIGAPAKGNTFLNYYNLDASVIDYVTDSSPAKQGKLTPRTRIPIVGDEVLGRYNRVNAILLSWNLAEPLKRALNAINPNTQYLNPYADS